MKLPEEGGQQERDIAQKFNGYAQVLEERWFRTASVLRRIGIVLKNTA